jgi:hypothetical protein
MTKNVELQPDTAKMLGQGLKMAASLVRQSQLEIRNGGVTDRTAERLADVAELLRDLGADFVAGANRAAAAKKPPPKPRKAVQ